MFTFIRNVKRASDFFSIHPDGLSLMTERRLKDVEASVNRLPKSIEDRTLTSIINLEYDVYELKQTIKSLQSKLDKEQEPAHLMLPLKQAKTSKKRRVIKLKAVKEEVKAVKSELTQSMVKRLFEYRDGELYWKLDRLRSKKGDKVRSNVNPVGYKQLYVYSKTYIAARIIFLMFHGYLPEYVSYIDGNPLNTRIENLRAATKSQITCYSRILKSNTSGYKGAYLNKKVGKYVAQIVKKGKHHYLGSFDTPEEAHKAYCKAAKKLHGEFVRVA